jgi:hypothetical protein
MRFGIIAISDAAEITIEDQVDVMVSPIMAIKLRNLLDGVLTKHYAPLLAKMQDGEPKAE